MSPVAESFAEDAHGIGQADAGGHPEGGKMASPTIEAVEIRMTLKQ